MSLPEYLVYRIWFDLSLLFLCYGAQAVQRARLWDLGIGGRIGLMGWLAVPVLPILVAADDILARLFPRGIGYYIWFVGALLTLLFAFAIFDSIIKVVPKLQTQILTGEAWNKLFALTPDATPVRDPVIVYYSSPGELVRWLDVNPGLVIPKAFPDGASQDEIEALGARQTRKIRPTFYFMGLVPVLTALIAGTWARIHSRPSVAILAGIASLTAVCWIFRLELRRQDRRLDREAMEVTKNAAAYIQTMERAARVITWTQTFPCGVQRDSVEVRSAAVRALVRVKIVDA